MAKKRRLEVSASAKDDRVDEESQDRSERDIAIEGTWSEWLLRVFLKYCYVLGLLFLICIVPLEVLRRYDGDLGLGVAFLTVLLILPLGFFGYLKLWGSGGIWGEEADDDL